MNACVGSPDNLTGQTSPRQLIRSNGCIEGRPRYRSDDTVRSIRARATTGALLIAACVLLAGCVSDGEIAPRLSRIDPAAAGLSGDASIASLDEAWWRAFGEPQLDALITKALADHPSLQSAEARVQAARASVSAARADAQPQVTGSFNTTRERFTSSDLAPLPLAGRTKTTTTLELDASWEVDFFGRNRAALEAALGTERAAEADMQAARTLLASNVASGYFELARLHAQRAVAERTLAQREQILELIQQRVRAGLDTHVELRQGEGSVPEAREQIEALDEQIARARHALAALTVQAPNALDDLTPELRSVRAVPLPAVVPADLLARRADIEAAHQRADAALADLAVAHTQFYPSVNLAAFAGMSAVGLNDLLDPDNRQFGVGPAIHLPIFDAGRLRSNYAHHAADVDAAVSAYNSAVLDAVREVADEISTLSSIDRQQREQSAAQEAAERAFNLALQRYGAGLGSYLTVLSVESSVFAQRRAGADLIARELVAEVALMRALGGGYVAPAALATNP